MTVATLTIGAGMAAPHLPDRGMSEEARTLGDLLSAVLDFPNSIAVGEPKRSAVTALSEAFSRAQYDNWVGLGSAAVEPSTYEYAATFLRLLPTTAPTPEVSVDSDGEISFEWDFGPRQVFSVSIGRDGTLTYAGLFGASKSHGTEQLAYAVPQAIALNLERLLGAAER